MSRDPGRGYRLPRGGPVWDGFEAAASACLSQDGQLSYISGLERQRSSDMLYLGIIRDERDLKITADASAELSIAS